MEVTIEEMIERNFVRADVPDPQQEPELYQAVRFTPAKNISV